MKKKYLIILIFIIFLSLITLVNAEDNTPEIEWKKCFGGSGADDANSIQQTADGGYIVAGETESDDGDLTGHRSDNWPRDGWIIKLDREGEIEWQKCLGGRRRDNAQSIQQTTDEGYIMAGYTSSNEDAEITGYHERYDYWIVKLDSQGKIQWKKTLGGSTSSEWVGSVKQTNDSGYIVSGCAMSIDGDVFGNHGHSGDFWIIKFRPDNELINNSN